MLYHTEKNYKESRWKRNHGNVYKFRQSGLSGSGKIRNLYRSETGPLNYTNKVLDTLQNCICNSRPRRFRTSVTAAMLTAYYSRGCHSEELFTELEMDNSTDFRKHLNQYDVIHLDIPWCIEPAGGPDQVISYITEHTIEEL